MKKLFFIASVLALFASCAKEQPENPVVSEPYRITINSTDTKTVFDPSTKKVVWDADDELSVIINDGEKDTHHKFVKVAGEENVFQTTTFAPVEGTDYTFNVLYPYEEHHTSIQEDGTANGYYYMPTSTTQAAMNDANHIDGVMYGKTTVSGTGEVFVNLSQAQQIFALTINNNSATTPLNVTKVVMANDGSQNLKGNYYVNPETGALVLQGSGRTEVTMSLNNGAIAAGKSGVVYIPSVPFALTAGQKLIFTITANGIEHKLEKTAPEAGWKFEAGKVNKAKFDITPEAVDPLVIPATIDFTSMDPTSELPAYLTYKVKGNYSDKAWQFGNDQDYAQFYVNDVVTSVKINAKYNPANPKNSSLSIYGSANGADFVEISRVSTTIEKYTDYTFDNIDASYRYIKIAYNKDGGNLAVKSVQFMGNAPVIEAGIKKLDVSIEGVNDGTFEYTVYNAEYKNVVVSSPESDTWLSANKGEDGVVVYTVDSNETGAVRTSSITISVEGANDVVIPVEQAGESAGEQWVLVTDATSLAVGNKVIIVASGSLKALSTTQQKNNRKDCEIEKNLDGKTVSFGSSSNVEILILAEGSQDNTFAFITTNDDGTQSSYNNDGYLCLASDNNYLTTKDATQADDGTSWSITFNEKNAIIQNISFTNRYLQHNASSSIFASYKTSSNQKPVSIYKLSN